MINFAVLLVVGVIAGQTYADEPEAIVGGNNAMGGQFPYQISLQYYGQHICGGSIISSTQILTAAHCVEDVSFLNRLEIVAGIVQLTDKKKDNTFKVKCVRMHEKYTGKVTDGWDYDIALITLETPIKFDRTKKPIAIATRNYAAGQYRGLASGWGNTYHGSQTPNHLQYVEVKVLSESDCLNAHKKSIFGGAFTNPKHICTLERNGQGICQGDSGGPLMINDELAGITSWNVPCAKGYADVFTQVFSHRSWIEKAKRMC